MHFLLSLALLMLFPQQGKAETLDIVTFNLYNRPIWRGARLQKTEELLTALQPDIVALQEVAKVFWWRNDPSERLAHALGLNRSRVWLENGVFMTSGVSILTRF